jgi:hypothetical protein
MLKRNKNVDAGLVNGSIGSVTGGFNMQKNGEIDSILVKFNNIDVPVPIQRESSSFEVLKCIFDKTKVICDRKAIEEYNRVRQQYRPNLDLSHSFISSEKRGHAVPHSIKGAQKVAESR